MHQFWPIQAYRSHCRNVHDAIIHSDTMNTSNTVPGHIVISVFNTNLSSGEWKNLGEKKNMTIIRVRIHVRMTNKPKSCGNYGAAAALTWC